MIYATIAVLLMVGAAWMALAGQTVLGTASAGLAVLLGLSLWRTRGLSAARVIPVDEVMEVVAHRAVKGVLRGHFVVHIRRERRLLRRLIILPGVLEEGES